MRAWRPMGSAGRPAAGLSLAVLLILGILLALSPQRAAVAAPPEVTGLRFGDRRAIAPASPSISTSRPTTSHDRAGDPSA